MGGEPGNEATKKGFPTLPGAGSGGCCLCLYIANFMFSVQHCVDFRVVKIHHEAQMHVYDTHAAFQPLSSHHMCVLLQTYRTPYT